MSRQKRTQNTILSFIALLIITYFIALPLIIAALTDYFGSLDAVLTSVIDLIPFGEIGYEFAIEIMKALHGQISSYIDTGDYLTIHYILTESAKGLFTVIIYKGLNLLILGIMGLSKPEGAWDKARELLVESLDALLAACLAPLPLDYIFSNLDSLGNIWSGIISALLSIILVGGGIAFFLFLGSLSIRTAIAYVLIKFLLINVTQLTVSYLFILCFLIGWINGIPKLVVTGASGFLLIAILLAGIEMMLDSVFKKTDHTI